MKLTTILSKILSESLHESVEEYSTWKRKNVTLRGIKEFGKSNEVYGSIGNGLYTVPLGNKSMAKQYGDLYFVVNAIPKNPKIFDGLNSWEIFRHTLKQNALRLDSSEMDVRDFEKNGYTIEDEMMKKGFDGAIIKGREMVHCKPKDIKYFKTENELKHYYETLL